MTPEQFGRIIGRPLTIQRAQDSDTLFWRCYYANTLFANAPRAAVSVPVIACGPNPERARQDFAQKIRGKYVRVIDGAGAFTEFPVPLSLSA